MAGQSIQIITGINNMGSQLMAHYKKSSLIKHQNAIKKYKLESGRELKFILFFVGLLVGLSIGAKI